MYFLSEVFLKVSEWVGKPFELAEWLKSNSTVGISEEFSCVFAFKFLTDMFLLFLIFNLEFASIIGLILV
jgi:hypothetical protein